MNWGKGIVIGMVIFMLFIATLVTAMFKQPADDYDKQYYEKGLAYNREYTMSQQVLKDNAQPQVKLIHDAIAIQFKTQVKGVVTFIRPSNGKMDRQIKLDADMVNIPLNDIEKGRWQMVFEWEAGGKQYLYKQEITLP